MAYSRALPKPGLPFPVSTLTLTKEHFALTTLARFPGGGSRCHTGPSGGDFSTRRRWCGVQGLVVERLGSRVIVENAWQPLG